MACLKPPPAVSPTASTTDPAQAGPTDDSTDAAMPVGTPDAEVPSAASRLPEVGSVPPDFTLPAAAGTQVELAKLASQGPVVLVFYRGHW